MSKHKNQLRGGRHGNTHLQKSWNKYGENNFEFSIHEKVESSLLLERESFWVQKYETLSPEKGYNYFLPNDLTIHRDRHPSYQKNKLVKFICINRVTKEKLFLDIQEIKDQLKIGSSMIYRCCSYWRKKNHGKRSTKNWMFINPADYKENFDYLTYDRLSEFRKAFQKKPRRKKKPEEIIPYSERNIKRFPILLKNVNTNEEVTFPSITKAIEDLNLVPTKVYKCLGAPFEKYKHRNYYFKFVTPV